MKNLKFKIEGMTCAACSGIIEKETKLLKGIESAQVNFASETGEFQTSETFDLEEFKALLVKLGYRASDNGLRNTNETMPTLLNRDFYKAVSSVTIASLTMFFAMVIPNNVIQALLTTILVFGFGLPYVKAVFRFHLNMNMLIGLGVLSSYIYSCYLVLNSPHAHSYFEGAAFIIAFSIVGHYLDNIAKTKARTNLSSLYKMQIKFASKIVNGEEINTPVIEIKNGDIIRLKPGEKFPLDGDIVAGETHADESMLSGESQAVSKSIGSKVFAGSLNIEGSVDIKILNTLHKTFVSEIVSFVERAQLKKAPIERYADKIVKIFVPIVLVISFITFVTWFLITNDLGMSVSHMVSVLVIACPCAMGLAVPMAIMISTSEAAKDGLLISGGYIVEKGSHIDTIVFDKTGTLTEGHPELSRTHFFDTSTDHDHVLTLAASVLQYSNHPLSQSIANYALKRALKLTDPDKFKSISGLGVVAQIGNLSLVLGNSDLIKQDNPDIVIPESFFQENIGSYVFMSVEKKLIAAFIINDPVKQDSAFLIKNLMEQNIDVWMLTGDHVGVANKIGKVLGIHPQNIRAGVKPVDKANFIIELQKKNKKVAMIGDGINDAPALSKADLSMAMSNGSDVALEASDISILEGKIILVSDFFKRSQRTMRVIKENLLLSFLYNLLCIPLAAGVFYPFYKLSLTPMWASLAMGLSSFSVIINSFRVKKLS